MKKTDKTKIILKYVLHDLEELKAVNVNPMDIHAISTIADFMVIATGNSSRHVHAIADNLIKKMKTRKIVCGIEGDLNNEWVLVDLGDVVVHIMQAKTRDFYNLEKLWSISSELLQP